MYRQPVKITGAIDLVMTAKVLQNLWERKSSSPHLPEPAEIIADFQELGRMGGVPARIKADKKGTATLLLYTSTYYLAAYPTSQGDGYSIAYVEPLDLHEHERLSRGILLLQTPYWAMYQEVVQLPRRSNEWNKIRDAWWTLEMQRRQESPEAVQELETLTPAHENYLNIISTLIEVTHKLEEDKNKLSALIPYRRVESAGEERYVRDIYIFHLAGTPQIDKKNMLRLKEVPDLQGRVFDLKGNRLTVKFENMIDRARIPNQGNFEPIVSGAVYRTQQEAIETLREGESKNKYLLRVLVDRHYQPYRYEGTAMPAASLDPEQLTAFRCALTVPDVLLVLGPPGAGKTRTITEIARQCGSKHQRVLITSKTHKAVDNVLERLPKDLTVVRFGHEDRIAESIRPKLIDEQTKEMQKKILLQTADNDQKLTSFVQHKSTVDQWVSYLTARISQLSDTEQRMHDLLQLRTYVEQRIRAQYAPRMSELATLLQQQQAEINHQQAQVDAWTKKRTTAQGRSQLRLIGSIFQMQADHYENRIEAGLTSINEMQNVYARTNQEYSALQDHLARTLATDSEYQRCIDSLGEVEANRTRLRGEAVNAVNTLQSMMQDIVPAPIPQYSLQILQEYVSWFNTARLLVEKRAKLLQDWRKELESRTEQLIPELLRYADVVGATCIGVATAKGLVDIEFDLAVVDEAGQICLPDLLVPLVRAKRSILVGDHHQLPPFVDSEVQTWLDSLSRETQQELGLMDEETDSEYITELLTKSAFEQLYTERADPAHLVRFTKQRRMPQVIADFVSHHFYDDQLSTAGDVKSVDAAHHDPLFRCPFAFVDTSSEPLKERREEKRRASENWEIEGFINKMEGRLIARIAAVYEQAGMEWVIIVPYRAQAQYIIQQLRGHIEELNFKLEDRVSTVDSFQGGERDRIIYGFTRSNDYGGIGFLKELRRLNVAMTRAKRQLVLVGDLCTLTQTDDEDFRTVAQSLQVYARQRGELLSYKEFQKRLPVSR